MSNIARYDIHGDIRGHVHKLTELLYDMDYGRHRRGCRHEDRKAVFVGDFVDREPGIDKVVIIDRSTVDVGYELLILGAWGCGGFGNDPLQTARDFRGALDGDFAGAFTRVVFAITDSSDHRRYLRPFYEVFSEA